jgi:type IV pilus assembly protein PilC
MQENYSIILIILISIPFIFKLLYGNILSIKKSVDKFLLFTPVIWPLIKTFYRYRFSKLLWDFYNAGLSPLVSLDQIANIFQNYHYKKKIIEVKKDLEVWLSMTESFEWSWLFNPILIQIIWIWEKAGNIWEVLDKMATFYRNELDTKVEWLTKIIEPLLMVFVAVVIWVIVASIFLPMADLIGSLSS